MLISTANLQIKKEIKRIYGLFVVITAEKWHVLDYLSFYHFWSIKHLWWAIVVIQTHLSRIAQKSLSVLCRVFKHSRTRKNRDISLGHDLLSY